MGNKLNQEPAGNIASRDYVDARTAEAKSHTDATTRTIIIYFWSFLIVVLAFVLAFVWYLHSDLKQQMQANKAEAKQERREAKQERQAIHNKLNILIQAHPPVRSQANPTSL